MSESPDIKTECTPMCNGCGIRRINPCGARFCPLTNSGDDLTDEDDELVGLDLEDQLDVLWDRANV